MTVRRFGFQPKGWCLSRSGNRSEHFRRYFAMGKIRGTPCAATFSYIVPLPNIFLTRLFSKLRLKRKDFQEILRLPWAQEVPSSNLGVRPKHLPCFLWLIENSLHSKLPCGIPPDRRAQFANRLVSRSSPAWRIGPNPFPLGGSFIFAAGNIDRFAHISKTFGHNASLATLLAALDQIEYQA
jgi:hypothetical protein